MRAPLLAALLAASALTAPAFAADPPSAGGPSAAPAQRTAAQAAPADPFLWLEQVSSPEAMAWVNGHNARSEAELKADPRYAVLYQEALAIGAARDRIPTGEFLHGEVYNFWTDADHLRGLWRKTTLADYRTPDPHWTTVIDLDALNKAEGKSWVWHGANCLRPAERLCLVSLSDGGEDAVTVREFDLDTSRFVEGGFVLPRSKERMAWLDKDTLLVAREWTSGDLTTSGYPYIVKRVTRGQPLDAAVEVFRGLKTDVSAGPEVLRDGQDRTLVTGERGIDFFHNAVSLIDAGAPRPVALPARSDLETMVDGRALLKLREDWTVGGRTYRAGSLLAMDAAALKADPAHPRPTLVWASGPRESLEQAAATRDKLLVASLNNVRGRVAVFTPMPGGGWSSRPLDVPDNLTVRVSDADKDSDRAFLTLSGFLTPSSYVLANADTGALDTVKTLPPKFDASRDVVEQFEATSTDGTRIPYFIVHRRDIAYDGSTPTILNAYGGFQVSETPNYSATNGKLWLERGGAWVLANIRGGGEFGPAWHEAGLSTKRQIVYDDFAAVAKDLIARRITSPRRLGIIGGSNGGLLMGVEFVQHPDLWNAVVIQVPLLDMIRISKIAAGASWQGEYGDVNADPKVMAFWRKTSPYQNLKAGVKYPEPFIFTTTKDDRVGPQHARKFAARMEAMGLPYLFYENTEGGHGAGADLKQQAHTTALTQTYLQEKLMDPAAPTATASR